MADRIKRWSSVEVVWRDAHGADNGWERLHARHSRPAPIRTVGLLARQSDAGVVVILSLDKQTKHFGGYVFIPTESIITITELEAK